MNKLLFLLAFCLSGSLNLFSQNIKVQKINESAFVLFGGGGNTLIIKGKTESLMIDGKMTPVSEELQKTIKENSAFPIKILINTHWHYDHTQNNPFFNEEDGAMIVAHENTYNRLSSKQTVPFFKGKFEPMDKSGLPIIVFKKNYELMLDGQSVLLYHIPNAHTDSDIIVWIPSQKIVHMGDLYFSQGFPFIDVDNQGSVNGMVSMCKRVLKMIPDDAVVVPGHGALKTKADLQEYTKMLEVSASKIRSMKASGMTLQEVVNNDPTQRFNEKWVKGFVDPTAFVTFLYNSK